MTKKATKTRKENKHNGEVWVDPDKEVTDTEPLLDEVK